MPYHKMSPSRFTVVSCTFQPTIPSDVQKNSKFTSEIEEFQIVNQDQILEASLKAEVGRQETNLEKLNAKIADVERQLIIKQKNVENLKDQKKSINEVVERELSDNKHAEYLWALYDRKPTSQKKQNAYEHFRIEVETSAMGAKQTSGSLTDDEDRKGRPADLNQETFRLIADYRDKRFDIESTLMGENRMEENITRELSNLKKKWPCGRDPLL